MAAYDVSFSFGDSLRLGPMPTPKRSAQFGELEVQGELTRALLGQRRSRNNGRAARPRGPNLGTWSTASLPVTGAFAQSLMSHSKWPMRTSSIAQSQTSDEPAV
jgi:hypothetical protein